MASGLKIRRAGVVVFDSWLAAGGVCMGIFSVPFEDWTITFPGAGIGRTPIVICGDGALGLPYTYDEALGYPRFFFPVGVSWPTDWRPSVGIYLK